ncbi:MAG: ankyrin repeat domain-containing protein [Deltaproteobacteria bacterium]|nr:ankyrin repeat domain-containing protein [Deltaproteobacteria bacterium]
MKMVFVLCVAVVCALFLSGLESKQLGGAPGEAAGAAVQRIDNEARIAGDVSASSTNGAALRGAALNGNLAEARRLIGSGVNIDEKDGIGNTALHLAASAGNAAIVRVLLDAGAKVDAQNNSLMTPLHMAVRHPDKEKHEAAYVLMARGANVDAKNIQGNAPVDMVDERVDKELFDYMKRISKKKPVTPESTAALYAKECASCHGVTGEGGAKGPPLKGTDFMLKNGVDEVAYVILYGRGVVYKKYGNIDGAMPGFERLGSEEVWAIAWHVKAFGGAIPLGGSVVVEEDNSSEEDSGEEGDGGDEESDGEEEGD